MTKASLLTLRWNYTITIVQGVPTFAFAAYGLLTPFGSTQTGMIVLSLVGALF